MYNVWYCWFDINHAHWTTLISQPLTFLFHSMFQAFVLLSWVGIVFVSALLVIVYNRMKWDVRTTDRKYFHILVMLIFIPGILVCPDISKLASIIALLLFIVLEVGDQLCMAQPTIVFISVLKKSPKTKIIAWIFLTNKRWTIIIIDIVYYSWNSCVMALVGLSLDWLVLFPVGRVNVENHHLAQTQTITSLHSN